MSYDLIGFRAQPGDTIAQSLQRLSDAAAASEPPTEDQWAQMVALADEIEAALNTGASGDLVDRADDSDDGCIELTTERYQIGLYPHETAIALPYWDEGDSVDWAEIDTICDAMRQAGWTILDSQTEQIINAGDRIGNDYAESYAIVTPALQGTAQPAQPAAAATQKRSWWQRLFDRH